MGPEYLVDKLKLIFENDKVPWQEYIDMTSVEEECTLKEEVFKPVNVLHKTEMRQDKVQLNFSIMDPLPEPPDVVIEPPISEVTSDSLFSFECLSSALSQDQKIICREALKFEALLCKLKHLNKMYMDLIPNKYCSENKEITIKLPCNRRSRCSGVAHIKVVIRKSVINDKISMHLTLNRSEFQKILNNLIVPPAGDFYAAAIHMEFTIRKLVTVIKKSCMTSSTIDLEKLGISLFYDQLSKAQEILLASGPSSSSSYIPAKHFFSTCIDILGKELIIDSDKECKTLLEVLLRNPAASELASPYFCPDKLPEEAFVDIYQEIIKAISPESINVIFVILSKVNFKKWLTLMSPSYFCRTQLLKHVTDALCACSNITKPEIAMVEDIIKRHFCQLLMFEFPELFANALENSLMGADLNALNVDIFYDIFCCLGCPLYNADYVESDVYSALRIFALNRMLPPDQKIYITSLPLPFDQIIATLDYLHTFFGRTPPKILYSKYKKYIKPMTILLGLLSYSLLEFQSETVIMPSGKSRVKHLWDALLRGFQFWISPQIDKSTSSLSFPWSVDEDIDARRMMSMFASCIEFHHVNFKANNCDESILSHLWDYYVDTYVKAGIRSYSVSVFHDAFSVLSWSSFCPTLHNMKCMCEVLQSELPECRQFLCNIFMKISWPKVLDKLIFAGSADFSRLTLSYMSVLVVQVGCEHSVLTMKSPFQKLLKCLEPFPWKFLLVEDIEEVLNMYVHLYNPKYVTSNRETHLDFYLLQFLKVVSGFIPIQEPVCVSDSSDALIQEKRCVFLEKIILFFTQSVKQDSPTEVLVDSVSQIIPYYLKEVEAIVLRECPSSQQMNMCIPLVMKIYSLFNCIENESINKRIMSPVLSWLRANVNTPLLLPSIAAAGASITDMSTLTAIVECSIETRYLAEIQDCSEVKNISNLISSCIKIPEGKQNEYIYSCVEQNACFCLYEYVHRQMCISTDAESHFMLMKRMISWLQRMKHIDSCEVKMILIWDQILGMASKLALKDDPTYAISSIQTFCQYLIGIGQEKETLLSTIGLIQSSIHSVNFRFLSMSLAAFILLQLPDCGGVRLDAHAPGYITPAHISPALKSTSEMCQPRPSKDGLKAFEDLKHLPSKKHFSAFKGHVEKIVQYIYNPNFCFLESRAVLKELALQVFPNPLYLHLLNT